MVGEHSGVVRFSAIDPVNIADVEVRAGNAAWPSRVLLGALAGGTDHRALDVVAVNDATGLREGEAVFWRPWRTLDTDVRGMPFLTPILDWLDSYENVLSNLMDRTALARYVVFDVSVDGGQDEVDRYVNQRRGTHTPPSGSVEVHSSNVKWNTITASTGAMEDTQAAQSALTSVAAGAGLARHWLAEPEGANRAVSHTMAEPVRRRVAGVQKIWLGLQTELVAFAVDQAVAHKRLDATVQVTDPQSGVDYEIPASKAFRVTGPEIAAADASITAQVLLNLSTGLQQMVETGVLTQKAASAAARKGWEDYMGVPYQAELDTPDVNPGDLATHIDDTAAQEARGGNRGNRYQLKSYWTRGEGLAKWVDTPHPWTSLRDHLARYMNPDEADRTASQWFHDTLGIWPGERKGKNPVGRG
jgi:hypothetical protein